MLIYKEGASREFSLPVVSRGETLRYRVDDVPWFYRPFWLVWSWILALMFGALLTILHVTCRIRFEGSEKLSPGANYIYSFWHRGLGLWFIAFLRRQRGQAWLQHPAAYMKPIHLVLGWMGVRICLGSRGEEGQHAAAVLTELVKDGASTVITPDGPKGPPEVLRKGVLHIAAGSGVPIVPVRLSASPAIRLRTWDGKWLPLPFSRIVVTFASPITVTAANFDEAARELAREMTL